MRFCPQPSVGFGSNPNLPLLQGGKGQWGSELILPWSQESPWYRKIMWPGCVAWEEAHYKWEVHRVLLLAAATLTSTSFLCQHTPPKGKLSMKEQKKQRWEKWAEQIHAGSMSGSSSPWLWFINTTLIFVHILFFCRKYIKNIFLVIRCWAVWLNLCCRRITNSSKSILKS